MWRPRQPGGPGVSLAVAIGTALAFALAIACVVTSAQAAPSAQAMRTPRAASLPEDAPYREADFARVPKIDTHVHLHGPLRGFLATMRADGFRVLTINVDYPDFPALADQRTQALALAAAHPGEIAWAASFALHDGDVDDPAWAARTNAGLDASLALGAMAVKVWKNVGMGVKDRAGRYVMLDDPRLDAVFEHVAARGVPLLGHQGEPLNCWLPLDRMTIAGDRSYFAEHPAYHLLLHPEVPDRAAQLAARDARLRRTPALRFVGLHLASLEADVDELASFLDRFPDAHVDLAARLVHLERQAAADRGRGREKVRMFLLRYQDRVLYGTDLTQLPDGEDAGFGREADQAWRDDWRFLATDTAMHSSEFPGAFRGLALPRGAIDNIYRLNALRVLGPRAWAAPEARVTIPPSPAQP